MPANPALSPPRRASRRGRAHTSYTRISSVSMLTAGRSAKPAAEMRTSRAKRASGRVRCDARGATEAGLGDRHCSRPVRALRRLRGLAPSSRSRDPRPHAAAARTGSSVSTNRCPRRFSSASTVDFPLPDRPAPSTFRSLTCRSPARPTASKHLPLPCRTAVHIDDSLNDLVPLEAGRRRLRSSRARCPRRRTATGAARMRGKLIAGPSAHECRALASR